MNPLQEKRAQPWRQVIGLLTLLILIAGITWLAIPGSNSASGSGLKVVAAENFWGNIASQIGGSHVQVTSIISDPNADPHLYESSARDASAVTSAKVVIINGLGYDDFMNKLLGASQTDRQVLTASQILGITDQGANPHLWYDIPNVNKVAGQIEASFIREDSKNKSDYEHNLANFDNSLNPLLQTINKIKQSFGGSPVAYTEPVPGYMLQATGLNVKTPEGFAKAIEDGNEPDPADTQNMYNLMTSKSIKVLLYNSQATSPVTEHVKDLAKQAGIPVIGVSETLPTSEPNYQAWQLNQLDELLKALQTK